jgi:hypothetical protein
LSARDSYLSPSTSRMSKQARRAAVQPERCADGAAGKDFARGSPVGDLDALALPEEEHGVIADHVATAQGLDADLVGGARPDVAVPFVTRALAEIAAGGLGHGLGQTQGRARRRVALGPVVRFHDFNVVGSTQSASRVCHQAQHHVHAH